MSDTALWQTIVGEIELTVSHGSYITWFKNTRVLRSQDNVLTIGVPNIFTKQQLEKKYKKLLDEMLAKNGASDITLDFKIYSAISKPKNSKKNDDEVVVVQDNQKRNSPQSSLQINGAPSITHTYRQGLNER